MGACCSCHRGGPIRRYPVEEERREEEGGGGGGSILRGDGGSRVRLQGSSKYVSMYSQQGRKGVNQDSMTVWEVRDWKFEILRKRFLLVVLDFDHGLDLERFIASWPSLLKVLNWYMEVIGLGDRRQLNFFEWFVVILIKILDW